MTDFRALCEELLDELELWSSWHDATDLKDRAGSALHFALAEQPVGPTPIPVAERLPGPEDCDAEGQCWWWDTAAESWIPALYAHWTDFTHWLPANALPVPTND
jgi:hypothetical protein